MYAYNFEGRRYDVGNKLGFLEATVEFAFKKRRFERGIFKLFNWYCRKRNKSICQK